jgi:hypothetical protein
LVQEAENVFGVHAVEAAHSADERQKLHAKIGQLAMENDFLSTALGYGR